MPNPNSGYYDYYRSDGTARVSSGSIPLFMRIASCLKYADRITAVQQYRQETGYPLQQCMDFVDSITNGFNIVKSGAKLEEKQVPMPDYVKRVQDVVSDTIVKPSGKSIRRGTIVELVRQYPDDLVTWMLGDFGRYLLTFSNMVADTHPSLADINNGTLAEGGVVYNRVKEQMRIAGIAREEKFKEMPAAWCRWFNRNHQNVSKVLLKPPARFLKSSVKRKEARLLSQPKDIDLSQVYEKGRRDTWDMLPDDFVPYTRMGPGFRKETEYYKRMGGHIKSLGMAHYAKALEGDVSKFDEILAEQYMGFIKMRMVDAAMIAAKAMGGKWGDGDKAIRIYIPASHFSQAFWSTESKSKSQNQPMLVDVSDKHVVLDANYRQANGQELKLILTPRVYPIEKFMAMKPAGVAKMLEALDSHVDANGHPLFDNYWVVVPGVTVNTGSCDTWQFSDNKQTYKFIEYWDYATALDQYLIKEGQLFGILLGEQINTRACYFINYFI